jgi:hypothetical protein
MKYERCYLINMNFVMVKDSLLFLISIYTIICLD